MQVQTQVYNLFISVIVIPSFITYYACEYVQKNMSSISWYHHGMHFSSVGCLVNAKYKCFI